MFQREVLVPRPRLWPWRPCLAQPLSSAAQNSQPQGWVKGGEGVPTGTGTIPAPPSPPTSSVALTQCYLLSIMPSSSPRPHVTGGPPPKQKHNDCQHNKVFFSFFLAFALGETSTPPPGRSRGLRGTRNELKGRRGSHRGTILSPRGVCGGRELCFLHPTSSLPTATAITLECVPILSPAHVCYLCPHGCIYGKQRPCHPARWKHPKAGKGSCLSGLRHLQEDKRGPGRQLTLFSKHKYIS